MTDERSFLKITKTLSKYQFSINYCNNTINNTKQLQYVELIELFHTKDLLCHT